MDESDMMGEQLELKEIIPAPKGLYVVYRNTENPVNEDDEVPDLIRCPALLIGVYEDQETGMRLVCPIDEASLSDGGIFPPSQCVNYEGIAVKGTKFGVEDDDEDDAEEDFRTWNARRLFLMAVQAVTLCGALNLTMREFELNGWESALKLLLCAVYGVLLGLSFHLWKSR